MNKVFYRVTKIEAGENGKFNVSAQLDDDTKKKKRRITVEVDDPTSFYVGQKCAPVLEDAS